jgi:hypothetical protein
MPSSGEPLFGCAAPGRTVLYVTSQWHANISAPVGSCVLCGGSSEVPPKYLLSWPSTPSRPSAFYSWELLAEALHTSMTAPYSVQAFCESRQRIHEDCMPPGTAQPSDTVWRCFGPALDRYRPSHMQLLRPITLGLPVFGAGVGTGSGITNLSCPACSTNCRALQADACMGLPHYDKAAKSQRDRPSAHESAGSKWVSDPEVRELLVERGRAQIVLQDACSDFTAARVVGRASATYDIKGKVLGWPLTGSGQALGARGGQGREQGVAVLQRMRGQVCPCNNVLLQRFAPAPM